MGIVLLVASELKSQNLRWFVNNSILAVITCYPTARS